MACFLRPVAVSYVLVHRANQVILLQYEDKLDPARSSGESLAGLMGLGERVLSD